MWFLDKHDKQEPTTKLSQFHNKIFVSYKKLCKKQNLDTAKCLDIYKFYVAATDFWPNRFYNIDLLCV